MTRTIPTAALREAVYAYVEGGSESVATPGGAFEGKRFIAASSTKGGWSRIGEVLGYADGEVCRDSMRKLLARDEITLDDPAANRRAEQAWGYDYLELVDRLCVAINRPDLAAELIPVEEQDAVEAYTDALGSCVVCSRGLHDPVMPRAKLDRAELAAHVEAFPTRHKRWNVCGPCVAKIHPYGPTLGAHSGSRAAKLPPAEVTRLYLRYCAEGPSFDQLATAERLSARYGFSTDTTAGANLSHYFARAGWPTRDRNTGRISSFAWARAQGDFGRFTAAELRKLHLLHVRGEKLSVLELGRRLHERKGYKTPSSCQAAILDGWKHLGLKARDRIEMCVEMSTKHGMARRARPKGGGKFGNGSKSSGYKRWLMNQRAGRETRNPICEGTVKRTGKPCGARAVDGGVYCYLHDPANAEARAQHGREHSARLRRIRPTVEWPTWWEELRAVRELVGNRALAEALGVSVSTVKTLCTPGNADRPVGFTVDRARRWQAAFAHLTAPQEEVAA